MEAQKLLIIDDEPGMRNVLSRALHIAGYKTTAVETAEEGLKLIENDDSFKVVVSDLNLPGMSGLEFLKKVKSETPHLLVLIITAYSEINSAIEALREGAYDYIPKPFKPDLLVAAVNRAFDTISLVKKVKDLSDQLTEKYGFEAIIGQSAQLKAAITKAERIARTQESVLITGDSGTGKELFARAIHHNSDRADKPYIVVNCAAIPDNLLESELFGHKKGAFTGATVDKLGLIQAADTGTIFFDEIGEVSQMIQAKLLRFLQDHRVRRLGDTKEAIVDIRVIAATNKNLQEQVDNGNFRNDLYYRLRVLEILVPPLREHPEDIPLLVSHFMHKENCPPCDFESGVCLSPDALRTLIRYPWPGNVRELENLIKQLKVLCGSGGITQYDLPEYFLQTGNSNSGTLLFNNDGAPYSQARAKVLEEFNRSIITKALRETEGNISKASKNLQTPKSNILRLMKKYEIQSKGN